MSEELYATAKWCALDGTRETLVTLGIIVLQTDLKLNRLDEVALLLAVGLSQ